MKYFKFLFIICFISLMLVSCGDDSSPTNDDDISKYRPTTVTFYDSLTNEKQKSKILHYTGKLLTSIDVQDANDETTETITFEYDGDKLIKKSSSKYATVSTLHYSTDGKLDIRTIMYDNGESSYEAKYKFLYDGNDIIKLEEYGYANSAWDAEYSYIYDYIYNDSKQLISCIGKSKNDSTGAWELAEKDTLVYTNKNITQYNILYDSVNYANYFLAYDNDNRLTTFDIEYNHNPVFRTLLCEYDNDNLTPVFFKTNHDEAAVHIDIDWEKQESNIFEVSKLLTMEEPFNLISEYFNLLVLIVND